MQEQSPPPFDKKGLTRTLDAVEQMLDDSKETRKKYPSPEDEDYGKNLTQDQINELRIKKTQADKGKDKEKEPEIKKDEIKDSSDKQDNKKTLNESPEDDTDNLYEMVNGYARLRVRDPDSGLYRFFYPNFFIKPQPELRGARLFGDTTAKSLDEYFKSKGNKNG